MLRNGLARKLISNIPAYMGGMGIAPAKGDHKKLVEIIPLHGCLIDYRSNTWDFTPGFKYQRRSPLKIKFGNADKQFKTYVKDYAAQILDSYDKKVSTVSQVMSSLIGILNYALEHNRYNMFILLDTNDIINAVEELQKHRESRKCMYMYIMYFVEFLKETHGLVLPIDLDIIGRKVVQMRDTAYGSTVRHHHRNIPDKFFQAIVETTNRVMRDETQQFNMRMTAGIILIDTQLGLRMLEVLALEKDMIFDYRCGDGKIRHYSVYNCIKAAKADCEVIKVKSICTDLLYETWKYMLELREKCEYKDKTNFMYILNFMPHSHTGNGVFPISDGSFTYMYKVFFGQYLRPWIEKDWKGIRRVSVPNLNDGKKYSIPTIHNLRVHFATSLYRQAFPLDLIESVMSHSPRSNTYDCYYDVDDDEFREAMVNRYKNKPSHATPDEEFEDFLEGLED